MTPWLILAAELLAAAQDSGSKPEPPRLEGVYTIVKGERDGRPISDEEIRGTQVVFKDNKIVSTGKDKKHLYAARYEFEGDARPARILMTGLEPREGERAVGLVELQGDTLKLCYNLPGGRPPRDFHAGDKQQCFILKRAQK